jgi:hypothetical protein
LAASPGVTFRHVNCSFAIVGVSANRRIRAMSRADPPEPELLLRVSTMGLFPAADDRDAASNYWVELKMAANTADDCRQ